VRRLHPELWRQKNWLLHHNKAVSYTAFSPRSFLTKINTTAVHTHSTFLFPGLKIKLKGRHFDTTEVIEADSLEVLNTLTEHKFQYAFKKWLKRWDRCIRAEGGHFEVDGGP
jgi:hypothetical protein